LSECFDNLIALHNREHAAAYARRFNEDVNWSFNRRSDLDFIRSLIPEPPLTSHDYLQHIEPNNVFESQYMMNPLFKAKSNNDEYCKYCGSILKYSIYHSIFYDFHICAECLEKHPIYFDPCGSYIHEHEMVVFEDPYMVPYNMYNHKESEYFIANISNQSVQILDRTSGFRRIFHLLYNLDNCQGCNQGEYWEDNEVCKLCNTRFKMDNYDTTPKEDKVLINQGEKVILFEKDGIVL